MRSRAASAFLVLLVLAVALPLTSAEERDIGPGYRRVAATEALELYFDEGALGLLVRDRRDGSVWRSSPVASAVEARLSDSWKQALASPFLVSFTDRTRGVGNVLDLSRPLINTSDDTRKVEQSTALTVEALPDGVKLRYRVERKVGSTAVGGWGGAQSQQGTLGFSVSFRIVGDYLEASVPSADIVEQGDFSLASIELLPYLGANADTSGGALLVPDGVGALLPYRESRGGATVSVTLPVWGQEQFPFSHARQPARGALPRELYFRLGEYTLSPYTASAGVFGLLRGGAGFLGIVTEGEEEAQVKAALSGHVVAYNRAGAEFWFRRPYTQHLSRSMNVTKLGDTRIPGSRTVRYVFVPGPRASYVDLARTYREYLTRERGVAPLAGEPTLPVHLFCGIRKRELLSNRLLTTTSYAQAARIIEELASRGASGLTYVLKGWAKGGFEGALPAKTEPEPRFGGRKGLEDLVSRAGAAGARLYLEVDYVTSIRGNPGFSMRSIVRDANRLPITNQEGTYVLSPSVAYEKFALREIPILAGMGVDGLHFRHLGSLVLSDRGEEHFQERGRAIEEWRRILDLARERGLGVSVEGANSYTLGLAGALTRVPGDASLRITGSEEVPFFPIAMHGLVSYSSAPLNLSGTKRQDLLRMIEYGAVPLFELTAEDSVLLQYTTYSGLFASRFEHWVDAVLEAHRIFVREMGHLHGVEIVDHERAGPGLARTVYGDGTEVLVNYTELPWQAGGREVPPEGYLVVKPEGGAR